MSNFTQLVSASGYDVNNMVFSTPVEQKIPDSKVTSKRIYISTKNADGTVGELCMATDEIYSFGVNINLDEKNKDIVTGYTMPLCLYNKNGPSESEKEFVETFNRIVEKCKDHIIENKDSLDQYSLERSELKKICNSLYYKRDPKNKAKIMDGVGPTLYAKLIHNKKKNEIETTFFNSQTGEEVNPMDLIEKHCFAKAVIKFESIFIGNKISLQIKLYECEVKMIDSGRKKLLPRPAASSTVNIVVKGNTYNPLDEDDDDNDTFDIDDAGSLKDGDTAVEKKDEEDVVVLEEKVETIEIKEEEVVKPKKKIVKVLKK
jgi:hypothetical protein